MKKFKIIVLIIMAMMGLLCGCSKMEGGEGMKMSNKKSEALDDYQFLIQEYGFTEEELDGIDVTTFIDTMDLRTTIVSKEEAHYLLEGMEEYYPSSPFNEIYLITTAEGEGKVSEGTSITKIGYYVVAGNMPTIAVFDVQNKVFYVNDETEHQMSDKQASSIRNIVDEYHIDQWNNTTTGKKEESTGSYGWKLVLQDDEGYYYVYGGSTPDGSTFPENYLEMDSMLMSICSSME